MRSRWCVPAVVVLAVGALVGACSENVRQPAADADSTPGNDRADISAALPDGTQIGTEETAGCPDQPSYDRVFSLVRNASGVSADGDRLIVQSGDTRLVFLARSLVPMTGTELVRSMLPQASTFEIDPQGPSPTSGLAVPDASCPDLWDTGWPGPAAAEAFDRFGPLVAPSMMIAVHIALFDDAEQAGERAAEATSILERCRRERPDDVWSPLVLEPLPTGRLLAAERASRTHMYDPYGRPSDLPQHRTTNFAVVVSGNVVASIIGVQAGVDPLDDQFVQQVHSTAERIAEALAQQQRAVEYQAGG
ncbi:MAG: hypothetical protein R2770_03175 [Acidimicrobiales bacterium]